MFLQRKRKCDFANEIQWILATQLFLGHPLAKGDIKDGRDI
jgi:hypothetical protein